MALAPSTQRSKSPWDSIIAVELDGIISGTPWMNLKGQR